MPESRKNNDRKGKTISFKSSKQAKDIMTSEQPKRIVRQPMWGENDSFTLTGTALANLVNHLEPYRAMIQMVDAIIVTGELEGKIKTQFFYEDGTPVPDTDTRLAVLNTQEEARINHWKDLVAKRQAEFQEIADKIPQEAEIVEPSKDEEKKPYPKMSIMKEDTPTASSNSVDEIDPLSQERISVDEIL